MIEVKNIQVQGHHFMGVYLNLPQYPIHLIISTHTILAQDSFAIDYFENMNKSVAVVLCHNAFGFNNLLASNVIGMNQIAKNKGVTLDMPAEEAIVLCEETQSQKV